MGFTIPSRLAEELWYSQAKALAFRHIEEKIAKLLLDHGQKNRLVGKDGNVHNPQPDKKAADESVTGCQVDVVSEYSAEAYTTMAIALCSNTQTHNIYELYTTELVGEMCKVIKEILKLDEDATPQWYFASDRHGAK